MLADWRRTCQSCGASRTIDGLLAQSDTGEVVLIGDGGLPPGLTKPALERWLAAELNDHLGFAKGNPAGRLLRNVRNGTTPKTALSEAGPVGLEVHGVQRRCRPGPVGVAVAVPIPGDTAVGTAILLQPTPQGKPAQTFTSSCSSAV